MSRKQYAAGDVYERKLKRVMERLEVSELAVAEEASA